MTVPDGTTHAAIYLRISLDRTGDEAGVRRQEEDCRRRCADRGWTILEVLSDNDMSASGKRRRPGFERLLTLIEERRAKYVVAWSLDRLQRSRRDELRLYEMCRAAGVTVSLVRGPDLEWETPSGRFVADTLSATARLEIEAKSDRHKRANRQAAMAGLRRSGRRPFGYEPDGITIREPEATALRDAYSAFLNGSTLAAICRSLNAAGFTTGADGPWTTSTLAYVLSNPRYAGLRGYAPLPGIGEPPLRGRPKLEVVGPAVWPGIVQEEVWQAAASRLKDPARRSGAKGGRGLLSGIARCGKVTGAGDDGEPVRCGAVVWLAVASSTRGRYRAYRCSTHPHLTRQASPVDWTVVEAVIGRVSRPDAGRLLQRQSHGPGIAELRLLARSKRLRLDELASLLADGVLTRAGVEEAAGRLHAELAEIERELADSGRVSVLGGLVHPGDPVAAREAWHVAGLDRQRVVVATLADVVLFSPKMGNGPFDPASVGVTWRDG